MLMPRRAAIAAGIGAALLAAFAFLAVAQRGDRPRSGDSHGSRERAIALYLKALDHKARLEEEEMVRLLVASAVADQGYFPPLFELMTLSSSYLPLFVRRAFASIEAIQPDSLHRVCVRALRLSLEGRGFDAPRPPRSAVESSDPCVLYWRVESAPTVMAEEALRIFKVLADRHPESLVIASYSTAALLRLGRWDEALAVTERILRRPPHALFRAPFLVWRALALHGLGRHEEAVAVEREADALTAQSPPGARLGFLEVQLSHEAVPGGKATTQESLAGHVRDVVGSSWDEVLAIAEVAPPGTRARFLSGHALRLLDNFGRLRASAEAWTRLAQLADSLGDPDFLAEVHRRRGRAFVKLGRLQDAREDLLAAREYARRAGNPLQAAEAEHNLLHLYEAAGRTEDAEAAGNAFVALAARVGLSPLRMMSYHDVAWFLQRRGESERARLLFQKMVADIDSLNDYRYWAGEYYELIGDLELALTYYRLSLDGKELEYPRALASLARVSERLGYSELALRYAALHDALENLPPEATPLRPGLLARMGRLDEAMEDLQRARERANTRGQVASWAALSLELAELEMRQEDWLRAAAVAESAAVAAARVGASEIQLKASALAGLAAIRSGTTPAHVALGRIREGVRGAEALRAPEVESQVQVWYADALLALGRLDEGLRALARAADLADAVAASLALDPARAGYRAGRIGISNRALEAIVARAAEPGAADRFAAWSVRRKGRDLQPAGESDPGDRRLAGRLAVNLSLREENGSRDADLGALRLQYAATLAPLRPGERRVALAPSIVSVQRAVAVDQAIIDYAVLDRIVAVLVITSDRARIHALPVHPDTLRARIGILRERMAPRVGSYVDMTRAAFDWRLAARLYADLLAPLEGDLGARRRLVIVPDGPLHLLPLDALIASAPDGSSAVRPGAVEFVLDRFEVTISPSLAFGVPARDPLPPGLAVAMAPGSDDPGLAGVAREIATIQAALGDREVVLLRGAEATEAALRGRADRAALIHFATHARPNDREPLFARLALSPSEGDDGLLHAFEVTELRLPGSLVVLSGCDTGTGRLAGGEGVLSLSRAFLQAGASGTVATLWPVGPAAAELAAAFYQALASGAAPAEALRSAKLALRNGAFSDPFYWAPFTFVSRGS